MIVDEHTLELQARIAELEQSREWWKRRWNENEQRIAKLEAVVRDAECLLTIVEPRSHKAEYLALLHKARVALDMESSAPENKPESP